MLATRTMSKDLSQIIAGVALLASWPTLVIALMRNHNPLYGYIVLLDRKPTLTTPARSSLRRALDCLPRFCWVTRLSWKDGGLLFGGCIGNRRP